MEFKYTRNRSSLGEFGLGWSAAWCHGVVFALLIGRAFHFALRCERQRNGKQNDMVRAQREVELSREKKIAREVEEQSNTEKAGNIRDL